MTTQSFSPTSRFSFLSDAHRLVAPFLLSLGTTYVQRLDVPLLSVWAGLSIGALATAILVVNNVRDRAEDAAANKRTLVVRYGRRFGVLEYVTCLLVAYAVPVGLALSNHGPYVLLVFVTLPLAHRELSALMTRDGPALNDTLAGTARLLLAYGLVLALGVALSTAQ